MVKAQSERPRPFSVPRAFDDLEHATQLLDESLGLFRECLRGLAELAEAASRFEHAARLRGAASRLMEARGVVSPQYGYRERRATGARAGFREAVLVSARTAGRSTGLEALDLEATIRNALAEPASDYRPVPAPLTPRERAVVMLIARGFTNRQIAEALVISERTADGHVANILGKLELRTRTQVAIWVVKHLSASAAGVRVGRPPESARSRSLESRRWPKSARS